MKNYIIKLKNYIIKLWYYKKLGGTFKDALEKITIIIDDNTNEKIEISRYNSIDLKIYAKEENIPIEYALQLVLRKEILKNDKIRDDDKQKFISIKGGGKR